MPPRALDSLTICGKCGERMSDLLSHYVENPPALVGPDYNIYRYTDQIYKVVKFKKPRNLISGPKKSKQKNDGSEVEKLDAALSRARRSVLEYALCNDWKYFCTFTLDKTKYDRFNLDKWHKDFTQWIRDQRKKAKKNGQVLDIPFLLVPELHENAAWHMHGLFGDISPLLIPFHCLRQQGVNVPDKLVNGGYFNWTDYQNKFGFCSFGLIQNKVACGFYVSKYISKNLQDSCQGYGLHLYYPSRGLNRASLHGGIYGDSGFLDSFLVNDYEWVKTGMTSLQHDLTWDFAMEYMDNSSISPLEAFSFETMPDADIRRFEEYFEGVQTYLEGFE